VGTDASQACPEQSRGIQARRSLGSPDVVTVLTASPGKVQGGSSGVEITRFESPAPGMPDPHIQSGAELNYAGIAAAARAPIFVKCNPRLSEATIAAANANPRRD
jgi:hypothetical protein